MPTCPQCGEPTNGNRVWHQGCDQKYRAATEARVGGPLANRELVETAEEYARGRLSLSEFSDRVRRAFATRQGDA